MQPKLADADANIVYSIDQNHYPMNIWVTSALFEYVNSLPLRPDPPPAHQSQITSRQQNGKSEDTKENVMGITRLTYVGWHLDVLGKDT
jgi:hypothetical protein